MNKFLEKIPEFIAWLQIVAAPTIVGVIIGFIVYLAEPSTFRLILGISITIIGVGIGILIANRIKKKRGTVEFMSKVIATPELDKKEEESKK